MNLIKLLLLLLITPKNLFNKKTKSINKNNGYDWRDYVIINNMTLPTNETINIDTINKIKILIKKKNILKTLEATHISIYDKVKLIKNNNEVTSYNVSAGGLFDKWLFD
jgi:cupin superfamily acireductone dioxygenase involved in methionine salvage